MKTIEDLRKSRDSREAILAEFGEVPESILKYDRSVKAIDLMAEERSYASKANDGGHVGKLATVFDVSGQSCRGAEGALSRFPQNVGRKLLLLYSKRGDTVVDPFAGHNSRMELCWRNGRNYIGHDICEKFMEANHKIAAMLAEEATADMFGGTEYTAWIKLHKCDSRAMPTESGIGDFTITSPPYWDLEQYGDEPDQLGIGKTYDTFLLGLAAVARENFRCLKAGAFCVWCVNDFRKGGRFYSYHEDTCAVLRAAGFVQHDIAITDLGPSMRAAFASQVIETKIIPKRHEYCLVFRKPEAPNSKVSYHADNAGGAQGKDSNDK